MSILGWVCLVIMITITFVGVVTRELHELRQQSDHKQRDPVQLYRDLLGHSYPWATDEEIEPVAQILYERDQKREAAGVYDLSFEDALEWIAENDPMPKTLSEYFSPAPAGPEGAHFELNLLPEPEDQDRTTVTFVSARQRHYLVLEHEAWEQMNKPKNVYVYVREAP